MGGAGDRKSIFIMNIKTLCLAILNDGEATGHGIRNISTQGEYTYFIDADYGSIYPALTMLEDDAMVASHMEGHPGFPAKKVYAITQKGRSIFCAALRLQVSVLLPI